MAKKTDYVERKLDDGSEHSDGMALTSLRELISDEMKSRDDCWDNMVSSIVELSCPYEDESVTSEFTDEILDRKFYDGHGGGDCHFFTMWTMERVYCLHEYDGAIWVISKARHPDGIPSRY